MGERLDQGNTLRLPGSTKDSLGLMILNTKRLVNTAVCFSLGRCMRGVDTELNLTMAGLLSCD